VDGKTQARAVGGDKFQMSIAGPASAEQLQPVVSDNSNGTYNVSWSTTVAGDYLITAKLEGYTVGGCPVSCTGRLNRQGMLKSFEKPCSCTRW
jgi:Filamin/ABP280 repeat